MNHIDQLASLKGRRGTLSLRHRCGIVLSAAVEVIDAKTNFGGTIIKIVDGRQVSAWVALDSVTFDVEEVSDERA
jgi:hypothetical protein